MPFGLHLSLYSMVRHWHFQLVCQGCNRFAALKSVLDKQAENAKPLTMECKEGSDTVCMVACRLLRLPGNTTRKLMLV